METTGGGGTEIGHAEQQRSYGQDHSTLSAAGDDSTASERQPSSSVTPGLSTAQLPVSDDASGEQQDGAGAPKKRRVRTGCLTCRQRKVKCDEIHPVCTACSRLEVACNWAPPASEGDPNSKTTRKRTRRACEQCRSVKAGCTREKPACSLCRSKGLECTYNPWPAHGGEDDYGDAIGHGLGNSSGHIFPKGEDVSPRRPDEVNLADYVLSESALQTPVQIAAQYSLGPTMKLQQQMGDAVTVRALVDVYFSRVYTSCWCSFLHKPSFMSAFDQDRVPLHLLQSVCAAANTLVAPDNDITWQWVLEVKQHLSGALIEPSTDMIAATLNIMLIQFSARRDSKAMWMLTGLAVRTAYALRLNFEDDESHLSKSEKESRRRMMWACFIFDQLSAGGQSEYTQVPLHAMHIRLPATERAYCYSMESHAPTLELPLSIASQNEEKGLLAHLTTIMAIRQRICCYVFNLSRESSLPWEHGSLFQSCTQDLEVFQNSLGPRCQLSKEAVGGRIASGQLCQLFELHLWMHQCSSDLNRIAIYGFAESARPEILLSAPLEWIKQIQDRCFQAARRVSETALFILDSHSDFCPDFGMSLVAFYESIRIQVWAFMHLVPPEHQQSAQQAALPRIKAVLTILMRAQRLFPLAGRLLRSILTLLKDTYIWRLLDAELLSPADNILGHQSHSAQASAFILDQPAGAGSVFARMQYELAKFRAAARKRSRSNQTSTSVPSMPNRSARPPHSSGVLGASGPYRDASEEEEEEEAAQRQAAGLGSAAGNNANSTGTSGTSGPAHGITQNGSHAQLPNNSTGLGPGVPMGPPTSASNGTNESPGQQQINLAPSPSFFWSDLLKIGFDEPTPQINSFYTGIPSNGHNTGGHHVHSQHQQQQQQGTSSNQTNDLHQQQNQNQLVPPEMVPGSYMTDPSSSSYHQTLSGSLHPIASAPNQVVPPNDGMSPYPTTDLLDSDASFWFGPLLATQTPMWNWQPAMQNGQEGGY